MPITAYTNHAIRGWDIGPGPLREVQIVGSTVMHLKGGKTPAARCETVDAGLRTFQLEFLFLDPELTKPVGKVPDLRQNSGRRSYVQGVVSCVQLSPDTILVLDLLRKEWKLNRKAALVKCVEMAAKEMGKHANTKV